MSSEAEIVERLRQRVAVEMCSFGPNKPFDIGANDGPNWMRYLPKAEQVTAEAAALIRELSARVASDAKRMGEMREALEKIRKLPRFADGDNEAQEIARAALGDA
jgi:hypothetical protein